MSAPTLPANYQPQQWIGDCAVDDGPMVSFDAAPVMLAMDPQDFAFHVREARRASGKDLDRLAMDSGLWKEGGTGYVNIDVDDLRGFLDDLDFGDGMSVTASMLDGARERLAGPTPGP